jgi:hypothetical protein
MKIANAKMGDPFYFYYEDPSHPPHPIEIAMFAHSRWMWTNCPIERLPAAWSAWAEWRTNQEYLIEWFSSLSERQRKEFTPWFTDESRYHYAHDIWTGWIHEGQWIAYKAIPKNDSNFLKANGPIKPDRDPQSDDLFDEEYRFIGDFDPRRDRWFWLAFRTAERYTFARGKEELPRRIQDYKFETKTYKPEEKQEYGVGWLSQLLEFPTKAISWYCSISENERQSVTPSYSSKLGSHRRLTRFYDRGQAKWEILDADDPRYVNALEW